jgi:bacteriorhodopsin
MAKAGFSMPLRGLPLGKSDVTDARLFTPQDADFKIDTPFAFPDVVRQIIPTSLSLAFFVLAVGSMFAANKATHIDHVYGSLLCAGAAFIASVVYNRIAHIRDQSMVPTALRSDVSRGNRPLAAQSQEMAVDVYRHILWLLAAPLVLLRLIDLAGGVGETWQNPTWTLAMIIASIILSLIVRTGTDELVFEAPNSGETMLTARKNLVVWFGALLSAGGVTIYAITLAGLLDAAKANPQNQREIEYFCFLTLGYCTLGLLAVVWRNAIGSLNGGTREYSEILSVTKDLGYGIVDFLLFGVLAYGSTAEIFLHPIADTSFFNATAIAL